MKKQNIFKRIAKAIAYPFVMCAIIKEEQERYDFFDRDIDRERWHRTCERRAKRAAKKAKKEAKRHEKV